jgi:OmpA-OmpF porin, OOP family
MDMLRSVREDSRRQAPRRWSDARTGIVFIALLLAGCHVMPAAEPPPPPPPPARAPAPPPPPAKKKIVLRGVNFDSNHSNVRPQDQPILDETIRFLRDEPAVSLVVDGYADDKESDPLKLSKRRAAAARDYLVQHGVAPNRIRVEGFGASDPVASNATAEGRAQNRRAEFKAIE